MYVKAAVNAQKAQAFLAVENASMTLILCVAPADHQQHHSC